MPAGYAHTVYGQEVLKRLPQDMQEVIKKDLDLFVIGLQGPDILFYYRPLKENEVNRIGNQMHKETGITLTDSFIMMPTKSVTAFLGMRNASGVSMP
jgi:hypothetical protein